jgi:hypothetical protein
MLFCARAAFADDVVTVEFSTREKGEEKGVELWGADGTWVWPNNATQTAKYAGDIVDFVRVSFYLHEPYNEDGSLSDGQIEKLDRALIYVEKIGKRIPVMLSPHNMAPGIIDWYKESDGSANIERWYNVMLMTKE